MSTSDGEEDVTGFDEEPLTDTEWMAEHEREREANKL